LIDGVVSRDVDAQVSVIAAQVRSARRLHDSIGRHQSMIAVGGGAAKLIFVTLIKTYDTRVEADLASIALKAEGIDGTVVGVGVAMEGGAEGVRLFVPDDQADAAREILRDA
jgi:hypothetical protein